MNTQKPPVHPRRFSYFSKKINMEKEEVLKLTNAICKNTLMETLKIEFTDVGADFLTARMPVTKTVYQPDGVLNGGATAALAESVGSAAVFILNKNPKAIVMGIEISANHLKSVKSGYVYATARPINLGKTIQLWEIKVEDDTQQLISICKLTTYTRYKE